MDWLSQLPWICPKCFAVIGEARLTQQQAQEALKAHQAERHRDKEPPTPLTLTQQGATEAVDQTDLKKVPLVSAKLLELSRIRSVAVAGVLQSNYQASLRTRSQELEISHMPLKLCCSRCGVQVRADRMEMHLLKRCNNREGKAVARRPGRAIQENLTSIPDSRPEAAQLQAQQTPPEPPKPPTADTITAPIGMRPTVPTERVYFTLLPPGTWKISDVIKHYQAYQNHVFNLNKRGQVDWHRIEPRNPQP